MPSDSKQSPAKAGRSSPLKSTSKAGRSSPLKGRRSKSTIKQCKKAPGWYVSSSHAQGDLQVIWITMSDGTNDAYAQPLIEAIDGNEEEEVSKIGLMGAYYMRMSLENPAPRLNTKNGYQRKMFVRVMDEGETSTDHQFNALKVIKAFIEQEVNNRYGTKVFIQQPGWDLTPAEPTPLCKLDHYLQYNELAKVVRALLDNVDSNWATNNMETAMQFFTEGHIPFQAVADLGFPTDSVVPLLNLLEENAE